MKTLFLITVFIFTAIHAKAQYYLHKTESQIRNTTPYDIHEFYDKYTGYKALYWVDESVHCRYVCYISNVTKEVVITDLMVKENFVGEWIERFNNNFTAVARNRWTSTTNSSLNIKLSYDDDNHGWLFFITDESGIHDFWGGK